MNQKNLELRFTAYDVRGKLGAEINREIAYRIARAAAQVLNAKTVVVGFDARITSSGLADSVSKGFCDSGADVLNIGFTGTEEVYSAVVELNSCVGIEITASHNPIDYNGMKIVKKGSLPLSKEEFDNIKRLSEDYNFNIPAYIGSVTNMEFEAREIYLKKIMSFVDLDKLKPLKIVINSATEQRVP